MWMMNWLSGFDGQLGRRSRNRPVYGRLRKWQFGQATSGLDLPYDRRPTRCNDSLR
jgi:hypothetical protein